MYGSPNTNTSLCPATPVRSPPLCPATPLRGTPSWPNLLSLQNNSGPGGAGAGAGAGGGNTSIINHSSSEGIDGLGLGLSNREEHIVVTGSAASHALSSSSSSSSSSGVHLLKNHSFCSSSSLGGPIGQSDTHLLLNETNTITYPHPSPFTITYPHPFTITYPQSSLCFLLLTNPPLPLSTPPPPFHHTHI